MEENEAIAMSEAQLHRRLSAERADMLSIIFFVLFGVLMLYLTVLSKKAVRREQARREEEQRQTIENTVKMLQLRRKHLINDIKNKNLAKVLTASNFKLVSMEKSDDIEQGNYSEKNTTCDENDDSKSTSLAQGKDELATDSSEFCHPLPTMQSQHLATSCQEGALQCSNKEPIDMLTVELGEVLLIRNETPVSIPILCSICLENYEEGDTVIVSSNVACTHGFHQECILDYLVQHEQGSYPCPCCRQDFLPTETNESCSKAE